MKLGTETASLVNHLYSRTAEPEPAIGMGATLLMYTDRDAHTVVSWDGKILGVTRDTVKRTDSNGMSDSQEYEYLPDWDGRPDFYKKDRNNKWVRVALNKETGRWKQYRCGNLKLGFKDAYHDYSF